MTWLSEVPSGTTRHAIDITKSKASAICGGGVGVCVDSEDANCPDCRFEQVLNRVARRFFDEAVSPNPDPAKGQWTYDTMTVGARSDYRETLRFLVKITLEETT